MLKKIIEFKKKELSDIKFNTPLTELKKKAKDICKTRNFPLAISNCKSKSVKIIGEIKRASPSLGIIRKDFDPLTISRIYEENGISAISILTDKNFFQGDIKYLKIVKENVTLPILRKDFIFDEYQLYESAAYLADAVLLIASILSRNQIMDYLSICKELGLHTLVEIHNFKDMEKILPLEELLSVIGINNRDLDTFKVNINNTLELIKELPKNKIIVSESGIKNSNNIAALIDAGVSSFLIGETFMKEEDIGKKVKELTTRCYY